MRELKFRVWDNHTKRYATFIYETNKDCYLFIGLSGYVTAFNCYGEEIDFEDDRFVIQQYTGLKDENGRDIYEGDILKWHQGADNLSEVVFQNGSFFVKGINWGSYWYLGDYNNFYKIIGNVFENPELIK